MLDEFKQELDRLAKAGRLKEFHPRHSRVGSKIAIRGSELIDFSSWDFFNLGQEPKVKRALHAEVEQHGLAAAASRLSSGTSPAHISTEQRIASFLGTESSVLFSSHNQAVLTLISTILGERDCVLVDERVQSPVQDAAYLVDAESLHFDLSNPDSLAKALEQAKNYRRKVIYIESVSPLTGAAVNLTDILTVAAKSDTQIIVDESYALGILGIRGAGLIEATTASAKDLFIVGSLARGVGVYGGFIAGPKLLINFLINRSKTFQTENVVPGAIAAAVESAINLIEIQSGTRERLRLAANNLRREFKRHAIPINEAESPILSIPSPKYIISSELSRGLFERGFYTEVLSQYNLREDGGILRLILNAAHTEDELNKLQFILPEIWKRICN